MKLDKELDRIVEMGVMIRQLRHQVKFLRTENKGLQELVALQEVYIDANRESDYLTVETIENMKSKFGALAK